MNRCSKFLGFNLKRICFYSTRLPENGTDLLHQIISKIKFTGPITVSEYIQTALAHPTLGYYMTKDVFGKQGDFTTSPEISQMFGELIGIWFLNEWMHYGCPVPVKLVELGPGRGTLTDDILRACKKFPDLMNNLSIHFIEISPKLTKIQREKLCNNTQTPFSNDSNCYESAISKYGPNINWYRDIIDVPPGWSFYLAHELFDALPVHIFQKKHDKWHEVLVDINYHKHNREKTDTDDQELMFVLSPGETAASSVFTKELKKIPDDQNHAEICAAGGVLIEQISKRLVNDGGLSLIVDYGHTGDKNDTFRAFKNHQLSNPLKNIGSSDLTVDVNFAYLRSCADNFNVNIHGPIEQSTFLKNMGIELRSDILIRNNPNDEDKILSGLKMLTEPNQMGKRFKFMSLISKNSNKTCSLKSYTPSGFISLN